ETKRAGVGEGGGLGALCAANARPGSRQIGELDLGAVVVAHSKFAGLDPGLTRFTHLGQAHLTIVERRAQAAPPAIAGTMLISSPLLSAVESPSKKRMSSSPT